MIFVEDLDEYIASIPPIPKVVKSCVKALEKGDLILAADIATKDLSLLFYLKEVVNKPIYGFRSEVKNSRQIFGVLGLGRARQLLYAYYIQLIVPKEWVVFDLNSTIFQEFQANMMVKWEHILKFLNIDDPAVLKSVSIIPAALVVCEAIFKDHLETILLIRAQKAMSYEEILVKTAGLHFKDIILKIAEKWDLPKDAIGPIEDLSENEFKSELVEYLKLLIGYELSRPKLIESGVSDFFEFTSYIDEERIVRFYEILGKIEDETLNKK